MLCWLRKECADQLDGIFTTIANLSLSRFIISCLPEIGREIRCVYKVYSNTLDSKSAKSLILFFWILNTNRDPNCKMEEIQEPIKNNINILIRFSTGMQSQIQNRVSSDGGRLQHRERIKFLAGP